VHADIYRLETVGEVLDLDVADLAEPTGAVALVEWGDGVAPLFGDEVLTVALRADPAASDEVRRVRVEGRGRSWIERLGAVAERCGGAP